MASGKTWTFTWSNKAKTFSFRVNLTETYDILTNKSTITITSMQMQATTAQSNSHWLNGVIRINGTPVITMSSTKGTHSVKAGAAYTWYDVRSDGAVATGSIDLEHNNDGSKTVLLEVLGSSEDSGLYFATTSGSNYWYLSSPVSESLVLTVIPRASDIGATDASIGAVSSIVVTKKATAYTHSIKYQFGDLVGYIKADGTVSNSEVKISATSIAFSIPISFYAEIPDAQKGTCTLVCTTYSDSTKIGDAKTTTFIVSTSKTECAPTVSGTVVDSNSTTINLTGDKSKLVRYMSNALCTITAKAKNSATIETKKIGDTTVTGNTRTINSIETSSVAFVATDSRSYSTTKLVTLDLIEYIKLTVNVQLQRTDPTSGNAILTIWGDYFNNSFGVVANSLTIQFRLKKSSGSYGNYQDVTAVLDGNSYSAEIALSGLDYESAYTVSVEATDALMHWTKTATVSQGIPVFDWGEHDFRFNLALLFTTNSYGSTLPTENLKQGQIFFLKNSGDGFTIRIYNGSTWL